MFHGSIVALVTPMHQDGSLDLDKLSTLLEFHIEQGTDGFVIVGTTGEQGTLSPKEQLQMISQAVSIVRNRVPVIAGTSAVSTDTVIALSNAAMQAGVDACLVMAPPYVKPTQEGLYLHYKKIAESVAMPFILYNVPGRTVCDMLPETVARLAHIPNIVSIKEATGKLDRLQALQELCGDRIGFLSGDDATAKDFVLQGGKGVISVTANVAPKLMHDMVQAASRKDKALADKLDAKLQALHHDLFVEANPIPVKWAVYKLGFIETGIRLPLTVLSSQYETKVFEAMRQAGVI